jgi:molybdenum cofactor biosynthesis enzyme MoaA
MKTTHCYQYQLKILQISRRNRCNESHHYCKYSDALVAEVRLLHSQGLRNCDISHKLGVDKRRISDWVSNPPKRRPKPIYMGIRRVCI